MMTRLRYHELVSGANIYITPYESQMYKGGSYPKPVLRPIVIAVHMALRAWSQYNGTR